MLQLNETGRVIGLCDFFIGQKLSEEYNFPEDHKKWLNDTLVVDFDKDRKIRFLEFYPYGGHPHPYIGNYKLLSKSLQRDIKELLKYSYCVKDGDSYYFPTIGLVIWTNKGLRDPGYSLGVYDYSYYDVYHDQPMRNLINNKDNIKIGAYIRF